MKLKNIMFFIAVAMMTIGCTEDESTGMQTEIPDIEIGDFAEEGYSVVSYEGNYLNLTADIKTDYPESEIVYKWYLIDPKNEDYIIDEETIPYEREFIGEGKVLAYEVNLAPGEYTIVLEAQASNGYLVSKTTTLKVSTNFSEGYYIMKETADGMTDIDIYRTSDNKLIGDVLSSVLGAPMAGKPVALSMAYSHCYIDEETNETASTDIASVAIANGDFIAFRTTDMHPILTRNNLQFGEMASDERPYRIVSGMMMNYYISNKGVSGNYQASLMPGSGKYGVSSIGGASPFITYQTWSIGMSMGIMYWSDESHNIYISDYNAACYEVEDPAITGLLDWDCIACGTNDYSGICHFVLQNHNTGERAMYIFECSFMGPMLTDVVPLEGTHLENAQLFSTNGSSASFVYCVDNNKIYGYDLLTGTEQEIRPASLPGNATISYISDQTFDGQEYFVVGTQNGDNYTLYFYNVLGGQPDGRPAFEISGTGYVKSMHYTKAGYDPSTVTPQIMD